MNSTAPLSKSAPCASPSSPNFFERRAPIGWLLLCILVGAELVRRWVTRSIPPDLSAYIAAAECFVAGQNPYGPQFFEAAHYGGYVFIYAPGTLPLLQWLAWVPVRIIALADGVLHVAALIAAMAWLRRYFSLDIPLGWLSGLALMLYWPAASDFNAGNMVTYMFAAFIGCIALAHHRTPRRWHLGAALLLGIILGFKPMWGIPAGLVLLLRKRWGLAAALFTGALCLGALSLVPWFGYPVLGDWWRRIGAVRAQYQSVDMLSLAPMLLVPTILVWVGAGVLLIRRLGALHPDVWVWSAASIFAWPRLGGYSFILCIPLLCYLWRQSGWKRMVVIAFPACIGMTLFEVFVPFNRPDYMYQFLLYIWAWVLAAVVFAKLWDNTSTPAGAQPTLKLS